jgi:hypothetical protein
MVRHAGLDPASRITLASGIRRDDGFEMFSGM